MEYLLNLKIYIMNSTNADEYQRLKIESFRCILCNIFDVGIGSIFSNNGFRMANCFCCLSQNAMVCLDHCRQELQQKSRKTARLFLQDQDQMFKTKTKTFIFVLEAPRDQYPGLEDYITAWQDRVSRHQICMTKTKTIVYKTRPIFGLRPVLY